MPFRMAYGTILPLAQRDLVDRTQAAVLCSVSSLITRHATAGKAVGWRGAMPVQGRVPKPWSIADAFETYGIRDWGKHYFHISDAGHVLVTPPGLEGQSIDLKEFA
jgi:hypothetical protein